MHRHPELSIQHIEQWRRTAVLLASGTTRNGKQKQFYVNADGWAYVHVNGVLISTFTELQAAIADYNDR